jgi:hypothetical protein
MVVLRVRSHAPVLLACPPPPPLLLFTLNLPRRLAGAAGALSGMVGTDSLLLLPLKLTLSSKNLRCRTATLYCTTWHYCHNNIVSF